MIEVRRLDGASARTHISALSAVLVECVEGGASVSFMAPFTFDDARVFFEGLLPQVESGARVLLGAFDGERLIGTVQLILSQPPNQPHRGEIAKLLVQPAARGQGVGAMLMQRAEEEALSAGKTLLVLDTGSAAAERIYTSRGWIRAGVIPNYALLPDGRPCHTTIFWKALGETVSFPSDLTVKGDPMPEKRTLERARQDKREGKAPSTQAGEFVREEFEHVKRGKHGVASRAQAIAIGLSKARKSGVDIPDRGGSMKNATKKSTAKKTTKKAAVKKSAAKKTTAKKKTASKRPAAKKAIKKATRKAAARKR